MISSIFSRLTILTFGTLYPAYYSFKTVRAKSVDEYMKWMMYWIVFAIFTAAENFTDIFLKWLPFYYELKIAIILWILPSMGNGSPVIYRKCVHPFLKKHETRVDRTLVQMKHRGQDMIFHYASEAIVFLGRGVMSIIHKNIPNGIMGLLASNHGMNETRSGVMRPVANSTLVIEEEPPSTSSTAAAAAVKVVKRRKSPGRTTTTKVIADDTLTMDQQAVSSLRGRSRKRQTKQDSDLDINLNESR